MVIFGNKAICTDFDEERLSFLERGIVPVYEPGLEGYFERNRKEGRLCFEKNDLPNDRERDIVFIAVGIPSKESGGSRSSLRLEGYENYCQGKP